MLFEMECIPQWCRSARNRGCLWEPVEAAVVGEEQVVSEEWVSEEVGAEFRVA